MNLRIPDSHSQRESKTKKKVEGQNKSLTTEGTQQLACQRAINCPCFENKSSRKMSTAKKKKNWLVEQGKRVLVKLKKFGEKIAKKKKASGLDNEPQEEVHELVTYDSKTIRSAGESVPFEKKPDPEKSQHVWSHWEDYSIVQVRAKGYKQHKQKQQSEPALFDTIGVDIFFEKLKISEIMHKVQLPLEKCSKKTKEEGESAVPDLFIVNMQMPASTQYTTVDSPGYNICLYFTPNQVMRQSLIDLAAGKTVDPAVKLIHRWFENCTKPDHVDLKERLKLFAYILNPNDCGMPGWTQRFNGKPVLIKRSGTIVKHPEHSILEVDVDIRHWGVMARQGVGALMPVIKRMQIVTSFFIEGQSDDELPERAMTCSSFYHIDRDNAFPLLKA